MSILDRIILTIYMIAMAFISLCIVAIPFNLISQDVFDLIKNGLYSNWYYSLTGILIFLVSVKLLLSGILLDRKANRCIIKPAEFGDIKISVETFESLSLRVVKQVTGIKDVKVKISIINGELIIIAKLLVMPEINIPQIVSEVQGRIKNHIESTTEINVKEIRVSVDNIASATATRVD